MTTDSQETTYRVYIDATIPSYLVSKPSRHPKTAEWQKITHEFWHDNRFEFILSDIVIAEISIGDRIQAADRLQAIEDLTVVDALDLERALVLRQVEFDSIVSWVEGIFPVGAVPCGCPHPSF